MTSGASPLWLRPVACTSMLPSAPFQGPSCYPWALVPLHPAGGRFGGGPPESLQGQFKHCVY